MRLIKSELFKLFSRKSFLITLCVMLIINCVSVFLAGGKFTDDNYNVPDSGYRALQAELASINPKERIRFLEEKVYEQKVYSAISYSKSFVENPILAEYRAQKYISGFPTNKNPYLYTGRSSSELDFLTRILEDAKSLDSYDEFLKSIHSQAEDMKNSPLFISVNSFSKENVQNTSQAYSNLKRKELPFNLTMNVQTSVQSRSLDICVLTLLFGAAMVMICEERESGAFSFFKSMKKGRLVLAKSKILAILMLSIGTTAFFLLCRIGLSGIRFGFCELTIPIQSIKGFIGCTLEINLWQYLLLFILSKSIAYFLVGLFFATVAALSKNNLLIYMLNGSVLIVETVLFISINHYSIWSPLKYINLISVLDVNANIFNYSNMNFMGKAINIAWVSIATALLLIIIFITIVSFCFCSYSGKKYNTFVFSQIVSSVFCIKPNRSVSLINHELYKIMVQSRGGMVLVIMILCCLISYTYYRIIPDKDDGYFKQYVAQYGGEITEDTVQFVESEINRFETLSQSDGVLAEISLNQKGGFDIFMERYAFAKQNNCKIIYDTGYNLLFSTKLLCGQMMFLIVFMCIFISPVFSVDSNARCLIMSTPKGRKASNVIRVLICSIATFFMFILTNIPATLRIISCYGMEQLEVSTICVSSLRGLFFEMPIWFYMVVRNFLLLVVVFSFMAIMLKVSSKMKTVSYCTILLLTLFAVPMFLFYEILL